jgi:tetratricopeptide (TPR) repeat protein
MDLRQPRLNRLYLRFLDSEDPAGFIKSVSENYTLGSLARLAVVGSRISRRAAVLAVSFLGDFSHNAVLGISLHDEDRGVRVIAENGIREMWRRDGSSEHRQRLEVIIRHNACEEFRRVGQLADSLLIDVPWFAEVWNQRAIARYQQERFEESIDDCRQTLELNPYHYPAAVGMAHCFLELGDAFAALESFRRSLRLNPDMEAVRTQVEYLQKTLDGR